MLAKLGTSSSVPQEELYKAVEGKTQKPLILQKALPCCCLNVAEESKFSLPVLHTSVVCSLSCFYQALVGLFAPPFLPQCRVALADADVPRSGWRTAELRRILQAQIWIKTQPRILLGFDHPESLQFEMQLTWVEDTWTELWPASGLCTCHTSTPQSKDTPRKRYAARAYPKRCRYPMLKASGSKIRSSACVVFGARNLKQAAPGLSGYVRARPGPSTAGPFRAPRIDMLTECHSQPTNELHWKIQGARRILCCNYVSYYLILYYIVFLFFLSILFSSILFYSSI